jgi:hypothetical protein
MSFAEGNWERFAPVQLRKKELPTYKVNGVFWNVFELLAVHPTYNGKLKNVWNRSEPPQLVFKKLPDMQRKRLTELANDVFKMKYDAAKFEHGRTNKKKSELLENVTSPAFDSDVIGATQQVEANSNSNVSAAADDVLQHIRKINVVFDKEVNGVEEVAENELQECFTLQAIIATEALASAAASPCSSARKVMSLGAAVDLNELETQSATRRLMFNAAPPSPTAVLESEDLDAVVTLIPPEQNLNRVQFSCSRFRSVEPGVRVDDGKADLDDEFGFRITFREIFRDWVIDEDIPRATAMRFIRTLKDELPYLGNISEDIYDMPKTWPGLTKLYSAKLNQEAPVITVKDGNNKVVREYINLGFAKQISTRKIDVVDATYDGEDRKLKPKCPHFYVEAWTDGVALKNTGNLNALWPVSCTIIAVGEHYEAPHRYVPQWAARPFDVAHYLGEIKPQKASDVIGDLVEELYSLDPRLPENAERINECGFSVTLLKFQGDLPAQAMVKCVRGHTSAEPCFKCRVVGKCVPNTSYGTMIFQIHNLLPRYDEFFLAYTNHQDTVSSKRDYYRG